jgi:hypothetical protein
MSVRHSVFTAKSCYEDATSKEETTCNLTATVYSKHPQVVSMFVGSSLRPQAADMPCHIDKGTA